MGSTAYPGTTDYVASNAPDLGLKDGSPVAVSVEYASSVVPATGQYAYPTNLGSSGVVALNIGSLSLEPSDDTSGSEGWPLIQFVEGEFAGVNFQYDFQNNGTQYRLLVDVTDWSIVIMEPGEQEVMNGSFSTQPISEEAAAQTT